MIPTLLATLLANLSLAGVDSASPSAVVAAMASVAAPTVTKPEPDETDSASSQASTHGRGELVPQSFGFGFRVLGDAPEILLHRAFTPTLSASIKATLRGDFFSEPSRSSHEYPNPNLGRRGRLAELQRDSSRFDLAVALPLQKRFACVGRVCGIAGLGPELRVLNSEGTFQALMYNDSITTIKTRRSEFRTGITGSLGATVRICKGVDLASEFGVKGWLASGDWSETIETFDGSVPTHFENGGDIDNGGISTWFGGIGLDAWF